MNEENGLHFNSDFEFQHPPQFQPLSVEAREVALTLAISVAQALIDNPPAPQPPTFTDEGILISETNPQLQPVELTAIQNAGRFAITARNLALFGNVDPNAELIPGVPIPDPDELVDDHARAIARYQIDLEGSPNSALYATIGNAALGALLSLDPQFRMEDMVEEIHADINYLTLGE